MQASSSVNSDSVQAGPLSKLDRVKLFVELLIKTVRSDDMLAVVTFGTSARVVQPLRRMSDDAKVYAHCFQRRTHTHTKPFYSSLDIVQDNPGEPVAEGTFRHLLDFLVQNEDNTGRHTNNPDALPPIQTNWCPISATPHHFTQNALPSTTLPIYRGLGLAANMLACIPGVPGLLFGEMGARFHRLKIRVRSYVPTVHTYLHVPAYVHDYI